MKKQLRILIRGIVFVFGLTPGFSHAQGILNNLQINGNFQVDVMYYQKDSAIGAQDVPEKLLMNGFGNINATLGHFSAGIRYESYLNPMLGFDPRYKGTGIPYRYVSYKNEDLEITAGSFYEQFGSGMIFRSYEERNLGYDNAMDGIRVRYTPFAGVTIKGIYGLQRSFFSKGPGIVRGVDAEFSINEMIKKLNNAPARIMIGGSVISKYQNADDPVYTLPKNVAAFAGRASVAYKNINLSGEYAYKINDPSAINNRIYKPGNGLVIQATYSRKGFGVYLAAKRIDNMNFRSNRDAVGNDVIMNYLPALTKQHTYSLVAKYPYGTQPNGEAGIQGQVIYTFKKHSSLGGKYGTTVALNYSRANAIDKQKINDSTEIGQTGTLGYKSDFFKIGKEKYFEDINVEISHKFSKKFKAILTYANFSYNVDVIESHAEGMVYAHVGVLDMTWSITDTKAIRTELQYLYTKEDDHEWAMGLLEYTIAPKWFFSVMDLYNYGNPEASKRIHYYKGSVAFAKGSNRLELSYGRQYSGILCVGGVCRYVPAANGITLTITSSF
ncbi:MAG: DUF6029 family protein [Bacteroidota bacterium]